MKLIDFKKQVPQPLREVTLLFLRDGERILLGMKKRGFGVGKWNGVGGKLEPGETVEAAAMRETWEEIGVKPKNLKRVAHLDFYFLHEPLDKNWNQRVITFFCDDWDGEPVESAEIMPQWYSIHELPFQNMWSDDIHWLPKVLRGKFVEAEFGFSSDGSVADFVLTEKELSG